MSVRSSIRQTARCCWRITITPWTSSSSTSSLSIIGITSWTSTAITFCCISGCWCWWARSAWIVSWFIFWCIRIRILFFSTTWCAWWISYNIMTRCLRISYQRNTRFYYFSSMAIFLIIIIVVMLLIILYKTQIFDKNWFKK